MWFVIFAVRPHTDVEPDPAVVQYISPVSRTQLQVIGSTSRYTVVLDLLPGSDHSRFWCSCPAFAFSVLLSETHFMCKHVLASRLAEKMDRVVVRKIGFEEWVGLISGKDIQMHYGVVYGTDNYT